MKKKYVFTGKTKQYLGKTLHQIKRLSNGLVGGWIESEKNLSHEGSCFVYKGAMVFDDAEVFDNARVYGNARVFDNARVYGNARVCGDARVFGNAEVRGYAEVYDDARVYGDALVFDNAGVWAWIHGKTKLGGNIKVKGLNLEEDVEITSNKDLENWLKLEKALGNR